MNIAMLTYEFPPYVNGGLGNYSKKIVEYMQKRDNKIYVFCYNTGNLPVIERRNNLTVIRPFLKIVNLLSRQKFFKSNSLGNSILFFLSVYFYNILSLVKLIKFNKECRLDIIAVHDWLSSLAGILAAIFLKTPVVFHVHNAYTSMTARKKKSIPGSIIKLFESVLSGIAGKVIVPTRKMQRLLEQNGWDRDKMEIIFHGSDTEFIQKSETPETIDKLKQLEAMINFPPSSIKLLYVGRLVPEKGVLDLIKALALVLKKRKNIKLIVAGKADAYAFEKKIRACIKERSLQDNIHIYYQFLDAEDVICHYLYSDICIFPSVYEPFGLVALEAMALGKPVILGNGFCRSTFDSSENKSALFIESNDPAGISDEIIRLIDNPGFTRKMIKNAYKYILPRFSWDKTVDKTLFAYKRIMEEKK